MPEPTWRRAWEDTESFRQTTKSFWAWEVVGTAMFGVVGGMAGAWLAPEHATTFQQSIYPTVGAAIGLVLGFVLTFGLIYGWSLFRAPYRQRDDALNMVKSIQQQCDIILDSVRFGLAFDTVTLGTGKSPEGISLAELPQFEVASNLEGSFSRSRSQRRR